MGTKLTEKKRRKYDAEFKAEVLKMVLNGRPVREVSASLGLGENLIYKWKSQSRNRNLPEVDGTSSAGPGISMGDYERLQSRLREAEQERDILKKALGIFSRGN